MTAASARPARSSTACCSIPSARRSPRKSAATTRPFCRNSCSARPNQTLSYRLFGESGPDHDKTFYFEVLLNGGAVGKGAGRSKKEAEQMAAKDALEKLTNQR